jgi:DNA invertase Pin-like site-specific DNA recombinase
MSAPKNIKYEILRLRQMRLSYRDIQKKLNCTRSTIHYHCRNSNLLDVGEKRYPLNQETKRLIHNFCKENSVKKAMIYFGLSKSTIYKYRKLQENECEKNNE